MAAVMMILGGYTFLLNPEKCTMPIKKKRAANIETIGGNAYFSWGTFIAGQQVEMTWKYMPIAQFSSFETKHNADIEIVWNPGGGTSYNVEMLSLEGKYFLDQTVTAIHRGDVKLKLVIMSEV
jgi:hypothetical protein